MSASIIDWEKIGSGGSNLLLLHCTFMGWTAEIIGGKEVSELKLMNGGSEAIREEAFRDVLSRLVSAPWKEENLNEGQIEALNKMVVYLKSAYLQEAQPTNGITLEELSASLLVAEE